MPPDALLGVGVEFLSIARRRKQQLQEAGEVAIAVAMEGGVTGIVKVYGDFWKVGGVVPDEVL